MHPYETERDPHEEIVRLEEYIEELDAKLVGAIRFDPGVMAATVAAFLGGIVVWGSNSSTAKEAAKESAAAEADRAALIEIINPRVIP